MFDKTITLFNREHTVGGDVWHALIIPGVQIITDRAAIVQRYGEQSRDNAALIIPYAGKKEICGCTFAPPKMYNANPSGRYTFASGTMFDFFIVGEWLGASDICDASYEKGFYNYIKTIYDDVFAITSATCYSTIPHFEVTGK